jgi:hypothetical protein
LFLAQHQFWRLSRSFAKGFKYFAGDFSDLGWIWVRFGTGGGNESSR